MTKLTPQELDARIENFAEDAMGIGKGLTGEDFAGELKQLIRDCIEAVTPERKVDFGLVTGKQPREYSKAIDTIQANTKELLR